MIKNLAKTLLFFFIIVVLAVFYLSFVGIKTDKFNKEITKKIFKINQKINLDLKDVKFLLDPLNFKTNITTKEPTIIFNGKKIEIKTVKTNLSLKALIRDEFVIEDLQVSTKKIKLNDLVLLIRSFNNSTELLILNNFIKKGFLTADIKIKFDDTGKIKDDYLISGFVKDAKFDMLNKYNLKNLGFKFDISKKIYSLTQIKTDFNDINLSSPLIEVLKKKDLSLIKGKIFTKEKSFSKGQLNLSLIHI